MWWLAPVVVGGAVTAASILAVTALFDSEARAARTRWEARRASVQRSVEEHRRNIENHLENAQRSYDFHLLTDLHFSSHRVADHAYSAMRDAQTTLDAMGAMLVEAKKTRAQVRQKLRREKEPSKRRELQAEIELLNELRAEIFPEKDAIKSQRNELRDEVRRLNARTRDLKHAIRDRCGWKGQDWYERLEARTAMRRALRGD